MDLSDYRVVILHGETYEDWLKRVAAPYFAARQELGRAASNAAQAMDDLALAFGQAEEYIETHPGDSPIPPVFVQD